MTETFWVATDREVVRVSGPDALTYLQGQVSQDLLPMAIGDRRWTFVLQPTGKVDVLARVTRTADGLNDPPADALVRESAGRLVPQVLVRRCSVAVHRLQLPLVDREHVHGRRHAQVPHRAAAGQQKGQQSEPQ